MKFHLLRYFVVLAEELHFGRAAERLAITQPPLSLALKALEAELDVRLIERDSKRVALTPAGSAFYLETIQILGHIRRAGETARAVGRGLRGRLDIGITSSNIYRDVPQIVDLFASAMPGIEVTMRELSSSEQLDQLSHGQLDAGFVNASTVPTGLASSAMPHDVFVCCLPETHPLARDATIDLRSMANETFVMPAREVAPANYDNVIAIFDAAGIHPPTRHVTRQWLTTVALVSQGAGVALVPSTIGRSGIAGVRFVPVAGSSKRSPVQIAWNPANPKPSLEVFVKTAQCYSNTVSTLNDTCSIRKGKS